MPENLELELAWDFVEKTDRSIFLTGKAGTGKTTFLHSLKSNSLKRLIVVAQTREEAILKMKRALDEYIIEGVKTTIPFHQKLMMDKDFRSGNFTTKFMETFEM